MDAIGLLGENIYSGETRKHFVADSYVKKAWKDVSDKAIFHYKSNYFNFRKLEREECAKLSVLPCLHI